jgi:lysophospholipase L1-like esterase
MNKCWFAAGISAMLLCGVARGQSGFKPAEPADMSITVDPGTAAMPGGAGVKYAAANLTFDPPEFRSAEVKAKAPRDYADWFAPWEPWPGPGLPIILKPGTDETGVLILGGLFHSVVTDSVVVASADGSKTFKMGEDCKYLSDWGQLANLGGRLGEPNVAELKVTYKYALQRLDLVQVDASGKVSVKKGASVIVCPALPEADKGSVALAGVYIAPWKVADNPNFAAASRGEGILPSRTAGVPPAIAPSASSVSSSAPFHTEKETANRGQDALATPDYAITKFEILPIHPAAPVAPIHKEAVVKALAKLQAGTAVKVAIMGASIEAGAEACAWWDEKIKFTDKDLAWRGRFVVGLRKRFLKATVTPIEAYEGGTQTKFGLQVLEKTVLPAKPDLVLIGFGGNDVSGPIGKGPNNPPEQFKKDMLAMVQKAKAGGAEVVLVVTMQTSPWLKNGQTQRWPAYRQVMLEIGDEEKVGVADVYTEWMNLATRGIPPYSQLHNWINHPGAFGHGVYAETVLRFFDP